MVPILVIEESNENDDRNRHAEKPKKK